MNDEPPDFRFRPHEHLRRPIDFQRVYSRRRSVSDDLLIVYAAANDKDYNRLGLSVSRKYGPAVRRNRLRRLYREAYRLTRHAMPKGFDLVLIPKTRDEPLLDHLKAALPRLVQRVVIRLKNDAEAQP